jgi:hypothetical protein
MMMMKTNPVRPAPNPTYTSYFHPIWMIWKIRNMVGTHWELKGNTVGTHIVNQGKMRKIPLQRIYLGGQNPFSHYTLE